MKIFPIFAVAMTLVNIYRKILKKRDLIHTMYGVSPFLKFKKMPSSLGIRTKMFYMCVVTRPSMIGERRYYLGWRIWIPYSYPASPSRPTIYEYRNDLVCWGNYEIIAGRLGKDTLVALYENVPERAIERLGKGKARIKKEFDVATFAKKVGMSYGSVLDILHDFITSLYSKMELDGAYPSEVFR